MAKSKKCEWCGKVFVPRSGDENRGYGRTCSQSCGASMREALKKGDGPVFPEEYDGRFDPDDEIDYQEDY